MKIALLKAKQGGIGGLEKWTELIFQKMVEKGHEVTLLTAKNLSSTIPPSVLLTCPKWPPSLFLNTFDRKVRKWLTQNKVDLVFGMDRNRFQTHLRAGNGVHAAFLKSRKLSEGALKYALSYLNPLHRTLLSIEKKSFENPGLQKIFANSFMVKNEILHYYNVDPQKIEVIHNGVEWKKWQTPFDNWEEEKEKWLKQFGLKADPIYLLFIGNGYKRKGLFPLISALAKTKRKEIHLLVVGKDKNMDLAISYAKNLQMEKRVHFFGQRKEVIPFYQIADAQVIPSFYDPFANVTVEALAMGLFVLSSSTNGGSEVLTKETGEVFSLKEPDSLLFSLEKVFKKDKSSSKTIRNSISHLDLSIVLTQLVNLTC